MTSALIGMGSNIDPERHLLSAAQHIRTLYSSARFSAVYQTAAVGMDGDDFLNACCLIEDVPKKNVLSAWLKSIEDDHGRERSEGSWKPRTLDLDLLMFDGQALDGDLQCYPHVFVPASELIVLKVPRYEAEEIALIDLSL
ncbi:MAG: 2-amino-4-hydroxy-6-hydroxymethyldihydropteridine diphosphokinase [Mariprofundaceae bacterium]